MTFPLESYNFDAKRQALLRERKLRSAVDFQLHNLPQPGGVTIAVGGLSSGFDYVGSG